MTIAIRHDHSATQFFKSASISILILSPSLAAGLYLIMDNPIPLLTPYQITCLILILALLDIVTVILLEPYRRYFSKLTPPAFFSAITAVLLFVIANAFNSFLNHRGYGSLTPFVVAAMALIYTTIFLEKNIALKCYLSLNSIAVILLWVLGSIDRVAIPF